MKATVTQPNSWQRVIEVEIPEPEVAEAFGSKLGEYRRDVRLPGFRKGKVPSALLKSRFGPSIRAEVIEKLVQDSYEQACRDHKITPVSEARVKELNTDEGVPITFRIETEVDPEVEVKGYEKLKVRAAPKKIKPDQVDEALEELRDRLSTLEDADRPSRKGDFLTVEYVSVSVDGEPRTDLRNPSYPIELGKSNLKEVDKGLMGSRAGEVVEMSVKFPRGYSDKDIAGKGGDMKIKVVKVQEKRLPDVDDEFLKKVGDFATVDALKESIRTDLERRELDRAKNEAYNKAIDTLIKTNPFDVPEARIAHYIDYMLEEAKKYSRGGVEPSREEIAGRYREAGIRAIKRHRIIDFIATKENIKATPEDVDTQIRGLAAMYNQDFEEVKKTFRQNGTSLRIRSDIREQKTLDYLIGEQNTENKE